MRVSRFTSPKNSSVETAITMRGVQVWETGYGGRGPITASLNLLESQVKTQQGSAIHVLASSSASVFIYLLFRWSPVCGIFIVVIKTVSMCRSDVEHVQCQLRQHRHNMVESLGRGIRPRALCRKQGTAEASMQEV